MHDTSHPQQDQQDQSAAPDVPVDWTDHASLTRTLLNRPIAIQFPGNSHESIGIVAGIFGRPPDFRIRILWGDRRETVVQADFLRLYGRPLAAGGAR